MFSKQSPRMLLLGVFLSVPAFAGRVELVSVADPAGSPTAGSAAHSEMAVSGDGRWIAFASTATDLVSGQVDSAGTYDVFLRDRQTGTTILVSHAAGSPTTAANKGSQEPVLSDDGRWIAYKSEATNLVPGQSDFLAGGYDVFLYDRVGGTTVLASRGIAPTAALNSSDTPQISRDGRFVAYIYSQSSLHLFARESGTTQAITPTSASQVMYPVISADNSTVVFISRSTSLVPSQVDTNDEFDLFAWDRATGTRTLVSRSTASSTTAGNGGVWTTRGGLSADGRFVLYASTSTDVVPGQVDPNTFTADVFLFDRVTETASLVTKAASAGGSNTTANSGSLNPLTGGLDATGRWAVFISSATDLVSGVTDENGEMDIFLFDRATGTTRLVSHRHGTTQVTGNGLSQPIAINETGTRILVQTSATDLIEGITDLNGTRDAYLYEVASGSFELISHTAASHATTADGEVRGYFMNRGGDVTAFAHDSALVSDDGNAGSDVFAFVPEDLDFYTLEPCRLFDSRRPEDGPALNSGFATVMEAAGACGIPATARALAVNLTVVQPGTSGYLTAYPGDGLPPLASSLNFGAGQTRTNNAIVRLAPSGNGTLAVRPMLGGGSVHVVIDVTGYFE